ncbi:Wzz/FepE/Etk N-terminal domain-containing protein, partial [Burkholderia sp. 8Y]|uniref:Wzz/FepE/Etk N-terminal domain-containing protein n=1 Tax=Burkholderia sp. 8Y TaxID=2653133 RepID=UPI001F3E87CE
MRQEVALSQKVATNDPPRHVMSHVDAIYDGRRLVAMVAVSIAVAGAGYAFLAKPVYRADILVQLERVQRDTSKDVYGDVSTMFDAKSDSTGEMEVLGSRLVVGQAVDKLNLVVNASPRYVPVIGEFIARYVHGISNPWPGGYVWGQEKIDVSRFDVPPSLYGRPFEITISTLRTYELVYGDIRVHGIIGRDVHATTPWGPLNIQVNAVEAQAGASFIVKRFSRVELVGAVRSKLSITDKGKDADVIRASYDAADPVGAAAVLNAIADAYLKQDLQRKSEEIARSLNFLRQQLPELKSRVEASERTLNAYRAQHGTVSLGDEATTLLRRSVEAQRRRVDLEEKRRELLSRYTVEHPAVSSIDSQLRVADDEINRIAQETASLPPLEQNVLGLQR